MGSKGGWSEMRASRLFQKFVLLRWSQQRIQRSLNRVKFNLNIHHVRDKHECTLMEVVVAPPAVHKCIKFLDQSIGPLRQHTH